MARRWLRHAGSDDPDSHTGLSHVVLRILPSVSLGLGALYLAFAIAHLLMLPRTTATVMSPVAAATSLILFGLTALLRRRAIPSRWAHATGAGVAGLVLLNSLLHLVLTAEIKQTTNLLLLIVGAGSLLLSTAWFAVLLTATLTGWAAVMLAHPSLALAPPSAALHLGIALLSATVLSVLIHNARVRTLRRVQRLRSRDAEQRKELEAALQAAQENEQRYRDLLHSANDLVQSVTPDGSILYVNRAWRETLGYSKEELDDLSIFDVIHPDSQAHCRRILRRLTEEACAERVEATFVTKDGEEIIVEGNVNCRFEDGAPVATRGIFRDVTQRVRAEEALRQRVAQLATLNRIGRQVASIFDRQALLQGAVDAVREDLAYLQAAVLLMDEEADDLYVAAATDNFWEVIPDGYRQPVGKGAIGRAAETGETVLVRDAFTDRRVYRVGDWLSPSSLSVPIKMGDRVIGILEVEADVRDAFDKNDQTALETMAAQIAIGIENAELYADIERRQLYLEGVLDAAPDAIVTLNADHRVVEWNRGAKTLFGYSQQEAIGHNIDDLVTGPGVHEEAVGFTETVMSGGQVPPTETVRYRKDGSPVEVIVAGSPILVEDELIGSVAVYTDISELKEAQEALRRYAAELEARNEELDAFAHTVAHDLKSPLQNLVGYADLLMDDYETLPGDIRQEALGTILATADRMNNIIGELLLLSEVRRGEVATETLDMGAIVDATRDRLGYLIGQYEAEIVMPATWPKAVGHKAWVEEVWANYLSNAIKYGGRPPRVELGATPQPDGSICFWVRDNGQGLTAEEQSSLFTPFTRLHQVKAEGHGLGLSIVRRIMDKLGGQVGVESEVGQGSKFFFTLLEA